MKSLFLFSLVILGIYLTNAELLQPEDCKCRLNTFTRIVGGKESTFRVPWQVSLNMMDYSNTLTHFCGGVIINHKYVMTTAQCVRDINNSTIDSLYIRIGVHNLKDIIVPEKYAKVYRVLVDTRYSRGQRSNEVGDFALLELDRSLQFDNFIQPACLPTFNEHYNDKVGALTAYGWGSINRPIFDGSTGKWYSKARLSAVLKEAQFNYVYPKGGDSHLIKVKSVRHGDSSCSQDNGGGLVHTVNGISRVVGIHQYTTGYRDGEYSVYCNGESGHARVAFYKGVLEFVIGKDYCTK